MSGGLLLTGADSSSVSGSLTFNIKADALTEPTPESLILSLTGNVASISVEINDTSQTPFYTLSSSHPAGIDEGEILTISLATNVPTDTSIPYQITGIQAEDLSSGSLSGNFVVGTTDSITLGIASDVTSGEGDETLRLTLTDQNQFIEVTINDTSTTAPSSNELISYEGASLYRSGISGDGQYAAWNAPFYDFHIFKKNGSTWEYSTTITPPDNSSTSKLAYRVERNVNFSYDGSVLLAHNSKSGVGVNNGQTWIYRRQPDGSYNLDQTIGTTSGGSNYWAYVSTISDDGNTIALLDYDNFKTYIYQYNGTSFVQFTTVSHPRTVAIELSSDGSSLYVAGDYFGSSHWVSKYSLNNGSYTLEVNQLSLDTSFTTGITDISISNNEKLMIVEKYFDGNGQIIDIFDYDDNTSTWVRRLESIHEPSLTAYSNALGQICMSDPDSNGVVTITNHGGRTYYLPGSLNTYLQASQTVNEGEELVVKLFTAIDGPSSGTYPYTISGITADDLDTTGSYAGMTGSFNVSDGVGSITLKLKEDVSHEEGLENLIISLDDGTDSITVRVNDTSILDLTPSEDGQLTPSVLQNQVPAISDDTQYATLSGNYSNGTVDVFKYNNSTLVYDRIQTIPKPSSASGYHGAQTSLNSDGTVLSVTDIYGDSNWGRVFIYRRPEGSLTFNETPDQIISNPDKTTGNQFFGQGLGLNSDGSILVANSMNRIQTYQYDGTSYNLLHSLSTAIQFRGCDISSDGQKLVAFGPYGNSNGTIRSWAWDGSAWINPVSYTMTTNYGNNMSIAMSNKNLIAVGEIGDYAGTNRVSFLDWDGSTWVPRPDTLVSAFGNANWTVNQGWAVALSEPKSDGTVTFIDFGGKIYNIPASFNTYLTAPFSVNEGEELVVNLFTALGVDSGTYPYTISGITADDLDTTGSYAGMTGNFEASGGVGSITLKLNEDSSNGEGLENLIISLDDGTHSVTVRVNDTSSLPESFELNMIEGYGGYGSISPDGTTITSHAIVNAAESDANVRVWSRNPVDSSISASPTYLITPPSGATSSWGSDHISMNNDGTILAISDYAANKTYVHEYDSVSDSYILAHTISNPGIDTGFGKASISADGTMMVIAGRRDSKVWTYQYNGSTWDLISSATVSISNRPEAVSISNYSKTVLVLADQYENIYTYDWVASTSSWSQRAGSPLSIGSLGYGDSLSLTKDGDILVVGSDGGSATWQVYDWDGSQWNLRFTADDDPDHTAVGAYVSSSSIINGYFAVAVTYKRNTNTDFRIINLIETPQNP